MALVYPFRAVRADGKWTAKVASYPYDIVSSEEARKIAEVNPLSFLRVTKAEVDLPADVNPYDEIVYETARVNFGEFRRKGFLIRDDVPCFYLYGMILNGHEQYGLGVCVDEAEFEAGRVKPHEHTLPEKEADRTRHIEKLNAQTGPILMAYRKKESIDELVRVVRAGPPEYEFLSDNGVVHALWVIRYHEMIRAIGAEFRAVDSLYIADGHHRAAAGVAVARRRNGGKNRDCRSILAVLFPHDQLRIRDYNRVVKDLGGLSNEAYLDMVGKTFDLVTDFGEKSPMIKGEFGMYLGGRWYGLKLKRDHAWTGDTVRDLDVSILQDHLLGPILGIRDPRGDARILFVGGSRGVEELERMVDSGENAVAFSLFPPTMEQMMRVADSGRVMPPKSTWFEPKLRDGILIHVLNDGEEDERKFRNGGKQGRR